MSVKSKSKSRLCRRNLLKENTRARLRARERDAARDRTRAKAKFDRQDYDGHSSEEGAGGKTDFNRVR